jgi:hypothetical protein
MMPFAQGSGSQASPRLNHRPNDRLHPQPDNETAAIVKIIKVRIFRMIESPFAASIEAAKLYPTAIDVQTQPLRFFMVGGESETGHVE